MATQGLRNTKPAARPKPTPQAEKSDLFLPPYLRGSLLTFVFLITVFAAIIVVPPAMSDYVAARWVWTDTRAILILLVAIAFLSLIALFHQQGFIVSSHERYEKTKAEVLDRAQRNQNRLFALLDVSKMMGIEASPRDLFDHITKTCGKVFECDMASLMLYDKDSNELVVRSIGGPGARPEAMNDRRPLGEGIAGWAAQHRQSLLLSRGCDVNQYPGLRLSSKNVLAAMVIPIVHEQRLYGVLNVSTRSTTVDYSEEDFRAAEVFAANAGASIRYTKLLMKVERAAQASGVPGSPPTPA